MDVCPSCGAFDDLDDFTGWCSKCTGHIVNPSDVRYCVRCSAAFVSNTSEFICCACKEERWANEIEHIMVIQNISYTRARQLIAIDNQAVCLCCGDVIPRATKGRHLFCSKQKCKSASRRLKHLRLGKGMTHPDALAQILNEIQFGRLSKEEKLKMAEEKLKSIVRLLHEKDIYPGPSKIKQMLGRDHLSSEECKWRREIMNELNIELMRPDLVSFKGR